MGVVPTLRDLHYSERERSALGVSLEWSSDIDAVHRRPNAGWWFVDVIESFYGSVRKLRCPGQQPRHLKVSHTYHPSGWFGHDTQTVSFDVSESDTHEMNGLATVTVRLRVASIPHLADRLI